MVTLWKFIDDFLYRNFLFIGSVILFIFHRKPPFDTYLKPFSYRFLP